MLHSESAPIEEIEEEKEEKKQNRPSLVKGRYLPSMKLNKEKLETFGIDAETRKMLMDAEYYHYLTIQIRFNTIVSLMVSLFGFSVCLICILSMDYAEVNRRWHISFTPSKFLQEFAFECNENNDHYWNMEDAKNPGFPKLRAETNFTCQVIYIYLYSTFQLIVLSTIPYRYDRFVKTEKEKKLDKEH